MTRWILIACLCGALAAAIQYAAGADARPVEPLTNDWFRVEPRGMINVAGVRFAFGEMIYRAGGQIKSTFSRKRQFLDETRKTWPGGGEIVTLLEIPEKDIQITRTLTLTNDTLIFEWEARAPTVAPKTQIICFQGHVFKTPGSFPFVATTTHGKTYQGDFTEGFEPVVGLKTLSLPRAEGRKLIIDFSKADGVTMRAQKDEKSPLLVVFQFLPWGYPPKSFLNPGQTLHWEISMKLKQGS